MNPKPELDPIKLRNKKAVIIQNSEKYPLDKCFLTYEGLVRYLDKELETHAGNVFNRENFEELRKTMSLVDKVCKYIFVNKNYLDNLREKKVIRKGSYLDKMLQEVVIED